MATENLGGISYTVDADTGDLINAQSAVDKTTKGMESSFKKLDTQVKKSQKEVEKAMAAQSRALGQTGIQVQQLVGQWQAGTPILTAFSQQAADIGIVLGAPMIGVITSLAAVLGGVLGSALSGVTDDAEDLAEKLREVVKAGTLTEDQVAFLAAEDRNLIQSNRELQAELSKEIATLERREERYRTLSTLQAQGQKLTVDERSSLAQLSKARSEDNEQLITARAQYDYLSYEIDKAQQSIDGYRASMAGSTKQTESQKEAVIQLIAAAQFQAETFGKSAKSIALYTASLNGATEAQLKAISATYDRIKAEQNPNLDVPLEQLLGWQQYYQSRVDGEKQLAQELSKRKQADTETFAETPIEQIVGWQQYYQSRIDGEIALQSQIKKTSEASKNSQTAQLTVANALLSSVTSATSGITSSLDEQSSAYKAAFAIQKAAAIAQTIVAAELAAAQILARDAGIFGLGAVATSNIVKGLGYASAGIIAGTAISGGRQYGGPTNAGGMYQFGEQNQPEILKEGGKSYLLPGNRGNVTPMGSGGSTSVVNQINVPPGYTATESQRTSADGLTTENVINIVEAQASNSGSRMNQGLRKSNTTSSRLGSPGRSR